MSAEWLAAWDLFRLPVTVAATLGVVAIVRWRQAKRRAARVAGAPSGEAWLAEICSMTRCPSCGRQGEAGLPEPVDAEYARGQWTTVATEVRFPCGCVAWVGCVTDGRAR